MHRQPRPSQHAAAGADAAERPDLRRGRPRPRPDVCSRRRRGSDAARIDLALSSGPWPAPPKPNERQSLLDVPRRARGAVYRGHARGRAEARCTSASPRRPTGVDAAELAAWTERLPRRPEPARDDHAVLNRHERPHDARLHDRRPCARRSIQPPHASSSRSALRPRRPRPLAGLLEPALRGRRRGVRRGRPRQAAGAGVVNPPHFPARPSGSSTSAWPAGRRSSRRFDHKPELSELDGQPLPESFTKGQQLAQLQSTELERPRAVRRRSRSTASRARRSPTSSRTSAAIADDICIVRSMDTEQINHDPAHTFMNTGSIITGRPSMGSWLLYGLGAETDRPARLRRAHLAGQAAARSRSRRGSGRRVPAQPVPGRSSSSRRGDAVHYLGNPDGRLPEHASGRSSTRSTGSTACSPRSGVDPEIATRIAPVRDGVPDADVASPS